jgi:hypothetical protein
MKYDIATPARPRQVVQVIDTREIAAFLPDHTHGTLRLRREVYLLNSYGHIEAGRWMLYPGANDRYLVTFSDGTKAVATSRPLRLALEACGQECPSGLLEDSVF